MGGRTRGGRSLAKKACSSGLVYRLMRPCICSVSRKRYSSRLYCFPSSAYPAAAEQLSALTPSQR